MQVLDDGIITDSTGRKIDFKNTVIIMTSNAGAENIVAPKNLGFNTSTDPDRDYKTMKSKVMEEVKRLFKPEFLNRIDETIVFHMLTRSDIAQIVDIMVNSINKRIGEQMNLHIELDDSAKALIVDKGYDEKYGARPLRRALQTLVEDELAEQILEGRIKNGDNVHITCADDGDKKLIFLQINVAIRQEIYYNKITFFLQTQSGGTAMAVVNDLIHIEGDGTISFGDYTLDTKTKLDNVEYNGDIYKVKTFKEITKLERNGMFVYESVPGTAVNNFSMNDGAVSMRVEGSEDPQITLELEPSTEYKVYVDGVSIGSMTTNISGKLVLSVTLGGGNSAEVKAVRA